MEAIFSNIDQGWNGDNCNRFLFCERASAIVEWYRKQMFLKEDYKFNFQHYYYKDEWGNTCFTCSIAFLPENSESKGPYFAVKSSNTPSCLDEFKLSMEKYILKLESEKRCKDTADRNAREYELRIKKIR